MSTPINDGGPAFPRDTKWNLDNSERQKGSRGMSLRDYFAARAMAGMFSSGMVEAANQCGVDPKLNEKAVAQSAYMMADAMLAARSK